MNKKKKVSLFDDNEEGQEEQNDNLDLGINKNYAHRYDNWRRLEEMQKIKDRYGEEAEGDSSSSESEPEWSDKHEEAFLKTLGALKSGDRSYFQDGKSYFKDAEEASLESPSVNKKNGKKGNKKDKKMTIKDYERKLVLEKGGQIDESDEEEEQRQTGRKGYDEEQEELRKSLSAAINGKDGVWGDNEDDGLLVERKKTKKELKEEDDDFYDWLKQEEGKKDKTKAKELRHLKKFWKDDKLEDSEKFLRDYILNKDYEPGEAEENPTYEEIVALEEDEKEMNKNHKFEQKYNFRFEDPDQDFIKQYPRTVAESMRTDANSRKDKRYDRDERKKREKDEKKKELKELQKMKKSEIEQKLEKLNKAAGCDIPLSLDELNADFDPKEFDKKMKAIFNEEYYGVEENVQEDEDEKPVFSDMDDSDFEDYDNLDVEELKKSVKLEEEGTDDDNDEESDEEVEEKAEKSMKNGKFDMVAAAQKAMAQDKQDSRRKKKRNAFKEAIAREKPLFDPKEKTFEQYFDEYYGYDYEDIIGDTVTKFKYREVEPNDFGLTSQEILDADERQLNAWASLKKVTAYRSNQEENFDKNAYKRKAQDVEKKKRVLATDFGGKKSMKRKAEDDEIEKEEQAIENEETQTKKKKKRGKKKPKIQGEVDQIEEDEGEKVIQHDEQEVEEDELPEIEVEKEPQEVEKVENGGEKKKNKRTRYKNKKDVIAEKYGKGITDSRVKAYGLNPNRLKKGLVYGSSK